MASMATPRLTHNKFVRVQSGTILVVSVWCTVLVVHARKEISPSFTILTSAPDLVYRAELLIQGWISLICLCVCPALRWYQAKPCKSCSTVKESCHSLDFLKCPLFSSVNTAPVQCTVFKSQFYTVCTKLCGQKLNSAMPSHSKPV